MATYIISPDAKNDLINIYQYSLAHWGSSRANTYLEKMRGQFNQLALHPLSGKVRLDIGDNLRSIPVANHVIFYRINSQSLVEIISVLHSSMDVESRLPPSR